MCAECGGETAVIGYEESEQLEVEPAKYFVWKIKREKRACKKCEERGVLAAPLPPRIIEKGLVSDGVVVATVVSKYADHCPLYRQSAILTRDVGLEISRAMMDGWVMRVGELLTPMVAAMRRELIGGAYLQADETPVGVQMHDRRGKNHQAYLWQYGSPGRGVVFDFRMSRPGRAEGISQALQGDLTNRRLCRLQRFGRIRCGTCGVLGARPAQTDGVGAPESKGRSRRAIADTGERAV